MSFSPGGCRAKEEIRGGWNCGSCSPRLRGREKKEDRRLRQSSGFETDINAFLLSPWILRISQAYLATWSWWWTVFLPLAKLLSPTCRFQGGFWILHLPYLDALGLCPIFRIWPQSLFLSSIVFFPLTLGGGRPTLSLLWQPLSWGHGDYRIVSVWWGRQGTVSSHERAQDFGMMRKNECVSLPSSLKVRGQDGTQAEVRPGRLWKFCFLWAAPLPLTHWPPLLLPLRRPKKPGEPQRQKIPPFAALVYPWRPSTASLMT